jgi:hypothetical protein
MSTDDKDNGKDSKDDHMIYGLTADEHFALQNDLNALPDTMPPRIVWERIRDQARAEGLIRRPVSARPSTWYAGIGLAAAAALVFVLAPGMFETPVSDFPTVPANEEPTNSTAVNGLNALMVQSRQLESDLRALPDEPLVMRASTAVTLSSLEERIAAIDYQLNASEVQMTPEEQELFWRERVRLMKSLVQLRYAQAQRTAF